MKSLNAPSKALFFALLAFAAMFSSQAFAGADTTFDPVNTILTNWMTGSYGKMAGLTSMGVGIIVAIAARSLMTLLVSAGIAISAYYGPTVLGGIVTATL